MISDIVYIFVPGGKHGIQETYRYDRLPYHPRVGEYVEFADLGVWKIERVHWQVSKGRLLVHLGLDDTDYEKYRHVA